MTEEERILRQKIFDELCSHFRSTIKTKDGRESDWYSYYVEMPWGCIKDIFAKVLLNEITDYRNSDEVLRHLYGDCVADLARRLNQIGDSLAESNELITNTEKKDD